MAQNYKEYLEEEFERAKKNFEKAKQERARIDMGLVIRISAYFDWGRTYFVQDLDETRAKQKAYEMAKQTFGCNLPDTLEEAEAMNDTGVPICIEVLETIEQIIL